MQGANVCNDKKNTPKRNRMNVNGGNGMKIEVLPDYSFALKEVFSGVSLVSRDNEEFGICMRDSGFEFQYAGVWYEAKGGVINTLWGKPLLEGAKNTEQANQPDKAG